MFFLAYLEVELLGHIVILCLISLRTTILVFEAAASFYTPTNIAHGFQFLHILSNTNFSFFLS